MPSSACDWSSDVCSRSEEHTSELQSHSEISYPVFCLKKKKKLLALRSAALPSSAISTTPTASAIPTASTPMSASGGPAFFFFNDTATTEIYTNLNTLSLHDALPI